MLEELLIRTGLPNFHPLAVHFPIALLFTAVLFDVLCLALRRQRWLDPAATSLYVLGTIGAAAAWWTGTQASTTMWDASGAAQAAMADHESLGLLTLIAFTVVTVLRVVVARRSRRDKVDALRHLAAARPRRRSRRAHPTGIDRSQGRRAGLRSRNGCDGHRGAGTVGDQLTCCRARNRR